MKSRLINIAFLALTFGACETKEDTGCIETRFASCDYGGGSTKEFTLDSVIDLAVYVYGTSGCARNPVVTYTKTNNIITFKSLLEYSGCVCTQIAPKFTKWVQLRDLDTGTYILNFPIQSTYFKTDTIRIKR